MEWTITSPGKVYDRQEGMVVYYHSASGNTHLISEIAGNLMIELLSGPKTTEELAGLFSDELSYLEMLDREQLVDDTLEELEIHDLVARK